MNINDSYIRVPTLRSLSCLLFFVLAFTQSSFGQTVGQWARFEASATNTRTYTSAYNDVTLNVTYTRPDNTTVNFWGFYDGGTTWKIRFMPDQLGTWQYSATFSDGAAGISGSFTCAASSIPGMLSRDETNQKWFGFKGGNHILIRSFHIGDRFFATNWDDPANSGDGNKRAAFLNWAQAQGYNTLSIASHYLNRNQAGRGQGWNTPNLWPLNATEYRKMETILDDLATRQIMVFPFAGFFGRSSNFPTNTTDQTRYIKYTLARIGSYWNIVLNVGGPEPRHPTNPFLSVADINRLGAEIATHDIYDHPLTVHNATGDDAFKNSSWSTFGDLQGPKTTSLSTMSSTLLNNHHASKPLFAAETIWFGNLYMPSFTDTDLRKLLYVVNISATALNFADMNGDSSSGFSGSMDINDTSASGKHQSKHDVVKQVWDYFASIPFYRMSPSQSLVSTGYCLADVGQQYLVYLPTGGSVNIAVQTGTTYNVTWVNARAPLTDQRAGGTTTTGSGLTAPDTNDWLAYLTPSGPSVATPTFSPAAGTYTSAQSVTISTTTSGASIRYSTDGSTPTATTGTVYSGPVTVSATTTIKAVGYATGVATSPVATANYTFNVPGTVVASVGGVWVNSSMTSQTGTFTATFDATPSADPTNALVGLSNGSQTAFSGFACAVRFSTAGNIDARNGGAYAAASTIPYAPNTTYAFRVVANIPAHTYSIYVTPSGGSELTVGTNYAFRTEQAAVTTLNNWGAVVDVAANGGAGTLTVANFAIGGAVPSTPVFNPAAGTYTSAQSVTITSAGSTSIRYTTDGSTPSATAGTVYSSPVAISAASTTLKAVGINATGASAVMSGVYTIGTSSSATLTATADTYAFGGSTGTNYGTATVLAAKDDGTTSVSFDRIAYVKFDLSGLAFTPTTATLILATDATTAAGTVTVNQCTTDSWTETGLTWANKPATGATIGTATVAAGVVTDKSINVGSYVNSQYTGDATKIVSFALTGNNAQLYFKSREAGAGNGPELVVGN